MFIENPHKKTTYSFRIKPDLLDDIKAYAKATNTTVPELLNTMIEEKVEDLHLTNDYLDINIENDIINLPTLTEMYNDGDYKEFNLITGGNLTSFYQIQKIPNNLDKWVRGKGYTSTKKGVSHEGISFVLAPELITEPEYLENPDLLLCCLIPIYIETVGDTVISVKTLSLPNAVEKIQQSQSNNLINDFITFKDNVFEEIRRFNFISQNIEKDQQGLYHLGSKTYAVKKQPLVKLKHNLISNLDTYCKEINTDIVKYDGKLVEKGKDDDISFKELLENPPNLFWEKIMETRAENKEKDKVIEELQAELDEVKNRQEKIMGLLMENINLSILTEGKYDEYNRSK